MTRIILYPLLALLVGCCPYGDLEPSTPVDGPDTGQALGDLLDLEEAWIYEGTIPGEAELLPRCADGECYKCLRVVGDVLVLSWYYGSWWVSAEYGSAVEEDGTYVVADRYEWYPFLFEGEELEEEVGYVVIVDEETDEYSAIGLASYDE